MKNAILPFIALFILFCSCSKKETIITGKIIGDADKLVYSNPYGGTSFAGFRDTIQIDEEGNFELKFILDQPAFISIWSAPTYQQCKLLIEQGGHYNLIIDTENGIEIAGTNEEGQRLYASRPNPPFISMEMGPLRKEESLLVIHENIKEKKEADIEQFRLLLDENKISASFFELVKKDRDVYYASIESRILLIKILELYNNDTQTPENTGILLSKLSEIYSQYPPNQEDLLLSSFWPEYAQFFISDYKQYAADDYKVEKNRELHNQKIIRTFVVDESKKYLTGKALEFFQATYIYQAGIQNKFEKELIALFEQFEKDYPQSIYSKYIQSDVDRIKNFYQKIEGGYGENISFVDGYENIDTLAEVVKSMKGKKIFIDVWASWCRPCKGEFIYAEDLSKMLKEENMEMLYISIDEENNDSQWKDLIKYYDLEGKHLRANPNLSSHLAGIYDDHGSISIPWYIIVDENGHILQRHAKRPSKIVSEKSIF